jgi:hypothetical protein
MSTLATNIQLFWQDRRISSEFRTGVSLHSHTTYSEESLGAWGRHVSSIPYLSRAFRRRSGAPLDFGQAFWTPPLTPRQAYRLEEKQIQRSFQLPGLVSLTDHDDIRAGTLLRVLDRFRNAPVSTEWTIPFENTFFHLGVHNLPGVEAPVFMDEMRAYTQRPRLSLLLELLEKLNSIRDVLVVLNHPLWDEHGLGSVCHERVLHRFLNAHGASVHALEANGLRSWEENQRVFACGKEFGLPVVAGGDRHGREPNAVLNLSRASTFPEFVQEVRLERFSHVVFMPQYRKALGMRVLQTVFEIIGDYPNNIFYREPDSTNAVPLTSVWDGNAAKAVKHVGALIQLFGRRRHPLAPRLQRHRSGQSRALMSIAHREDGASQPDVDAAAVAGVLE